MLEKVANLAANWMPKADSLRRLISDCVRSGDNNLPLPESTKNSKYKRCLTKFS